MTKIDVVTYEERYFMGSDLPPSKGVAASAHPNFMGLPYMRAHSMRNNNQILHDQTKCQEHF